MIPLTSRNYASPDTFVKDFLETLTPGVIPRDSFIKWDKIGGKASAEADALAFWLDVQGEFQAGAELQELLATRLSSCRHPARALRYAFDLMGHTGPIFVSRDDYVDIASLGAKVKSGDSLSARYAAQVVCGIGLDRLLACSSIEQAMMAVRVGLESHRRKNVGGKEFSTLVGVALTEIVDGLEDASSGEVTLKTEHSIRYGDGLTKRVDYAIQVDGKDRFGFEVNFYTSSGSKPTEIKRSYGEVGRGLESVGVALVWITDGAGYHKMARSLRDAYVILPNIYNLKHVRDALPVDLGIALSTAD